MFALHGWKKGARQPHSPEEVARAIVVKNPRIVAGKVAWQKEQFNRFATAGPRASAKDQERLRMRMAEERAAAAQVPGTAKRKGRV